MEEERYVANSISEYIECFKKMANFSESNKDYEMYYRGEPKDYEETSGTPGIARGVYWLSNNNESELMRECERRLPNEFAECKSTFERLVKMQHYGIPTRVLDITLDPLVALFFALYKDPKNHDDLSKKDAVVLVYKVPKEKICNYRSDKVSVVSNISVYSYDDLEISKLLVSIYRDKYKNSIEEIIREFLKDSCTLSLMPQLDEDNIRVFNDKNSIKHLLHEIKSEKPHFLDNINPNHLYSVFAVHPLLDNPRIKAQQGAFLLFGLDGNKHNLAKLEFSNIKLKKIFIPYSSKEAMLKDLILLGKTVDNIYPDWDGVSDFFRSFYNKNNFRDYYKSKSSEDSGVSQKENDC